jgi:hypothetical protein
MNDQQCRQRSEDNKASHHESPAVVCSAAYDLAQQRNIPVPAIVNHHFGTSMGAMDAPLSMASLEKSHAAKQRPDRRPLSQLRGTLSLKSVPAAGTPTAAPRLARSADERAREQRPD